MDERNPQSPNRRSLLIAASTLAVAPRFALAADYPTRPIDIIVPWGPGGGADQLGRLTAKLMEPEMKTSFPVVNVPGATGATGMAKLLSEPAEGYSMAIYIADTNALLAGKSPRWTIDDITPIAIMMQCPSFIFLAENGRIKDWAQFEKEARAKPKTLKVATLGFGSVDDMTLSYLAQKGIEVIQVPYAKPSERYVSVIGGHVDALYEQAGDVRQFITNKQIKPAMIFAKKRLPAFPDTPCSTELGYDITLPQFRSFVVKSGTPADRVKMLSDAMAKVAANQEYKDFLDKQYAADDSFIPADRAGHFLKQQLADMRSAMGKKA